MSNLRLNVTLAETDGQRKPIGKYHEVEIKAPDLDHSDLNRSLVDGLASYGSAARKAAAEMTGKPEDLFYPVSFEIEGAVTRDYTVEGVYPGDGGLWGDRVGGVNSSEAAFQAAWTMYDNEAGGMESLLEFEDTYEGYVRRIVRGLDMQRIESVAPAAPGRDEILSALEQVHADARAAGASWESLDAARSIIEAEQAALEQGDEIVYLEEASSPAP